MTIYFLPKHLAAHLWKHSEALEALETSIKGAKGVIVNVCAPQDVILDDVYEASQMIQEQVDPDATLIWGASLSDTLEDEMIVTVIATGLDFDPAKSENVVELPTVAAQAAQEEKAEEAAQEKEKSRAEAEDDGFLEIMKFFKK